MAMKLPREEWRETKWWQRVEGADDKTSVDGPSFRNSWRSSNRNMKAGTLLRWLLRRVLVLALCHVVAVQGMVLPCKREF